MWEGYVIDQADPTANAVNGAIEILEPKMLTTIRHG
jgi:hypothetical protein